MNKVLIDKKQELEDYLNSNPQLKMYKDRILQSLLLVKGGELLKFEVILDLNLAHLQILSDTIDVMKKKYKVKES